MVHLCWFLNSTNLNGLCSLFWQGCNVLNVTCNQNTSIIAIVFVCESQHQCLCVCACASQVLLTFMYACMHVCIYICLAHMGSYVAWYMWAWAPRLFPSSYIWALPGHLYPWIFIWFRHHKVRRTPLVIMENVKQCPLSFVKENMEPDYNVVLVIVTPRDVCVDHFGGERSYFVCRHSVTAEITADFHAAWWYDLQDVAAVTDLSHLRYYIHLLQLYIQSIKLFNM